MIVCLKCRAVTGRGASYCGRCGGSFGGPRCANGHRSPGNSAVGWCPVCRSREVVQPVPCLDLGILTRIAAWAAAILLARWVLRGFPQNAAKVGNALEWLAGPWLVREAGADLSFLLALAMFCRCVTACNPEFGRYDPFPKILAFLWKASWKGAALLWRLSLRCVEGKALPESAEKKRKRKEDG